MGATLRTFEGGLSKKCGEGWKQTKEEPSTTVVSLAVSDPFKFF